MKTSLLVLTLLIGTSFSVNAAPIIDRESSRTAAAKSGSGTNVGGGNGAAYLNTWCQDQRTVLVDAQEMASLNLENNGDYNYANKILVEGMQEALNPAANGQGTFFYKSIARGLEMATYLKADRGGVDTTVARTTYNILSKYYDFSLETVAQNLDMGAHLPYMAARNSYEMDQRAARYEANFVTYAHTQVNWLLKNLITSNVINGKTVYYPVGTTDSVITVSTILAKGVTSDLEESLWNTRFSCVIGDLKVLTKRLDSYKNNPTIFVDKKQALTYMTEKLLKIERALKQGGSCL